MTDVQFSNKNCPSPSHCEKSEKTIFMYTQYTAVCIFEKIVPCACSLNYSWSNPISFCHSWWENKGETLTKPDPPSCHHTLSVLVNVTLLSSIDCLFLSMGGPQNNQISPHHHKLASRCVTNDNSKVWELWWPPIFAPSSLGR